MPSPKTYDQFGQLIVPNHQFQQLPQFNTNYQQNYGGMPVQQLQYPNNYSSIQLQQQPLQQQVSFNASPSPSTNFNSPVRNNYTLFERQDINKRFEGNKMIQNQSNIMSQQPSLINNYQINEQNINTNQNLVYRNQNQNIPMQNEIITSQNQLPTQQSDTYLFRSNRYNTNGDTRSVNSVSYSRQNDQDNKSNYAYQVQKPRDRQFLSPDQNSLKSQRKKIFSPISDKTIASIESEISSFSRFRQNGVTNRMVTSQIGQQQEQIGQQQSQARLYQSQGRQQQQQQQQLFFQNNLQNRLLTSQSQQNNKLDEGSAKKKKIFSPAMDYSKHSPLTKNPIKIDEETYQQDNYNYNQNKDIQRNMINQNEFKKHLNYNINNDDNDAFYSPSQKQYQDQQLDYFKDDDIAEKFYDQQNEKDLSSYQSFNYQNQSYDGQDFERTKESISPEKNSAVKYLLDERVKRQLDGEYKKQQENEQIIAKRRKLFLTGVGGLVALIILTKIILTIASYFQR